MEELWGFYLVVDEISELGEPLSAIIYPIMHQFGVGNYVDFGRSEGIDLDDTNRHTTVQTFVESVMGL